MEPPAAEFAGPSAAPVVVNLGMACVDQLISLDHFPAPDSKQSAKSMVFAGGGNAANAAVALSRLGVRTRLVTWVGGDSLGLGAKAALEAEGVDCRGVTVGPPGTLTVAPFILLVNGTRTIVSQPLETRVELEEQDFDEHLLDGASLLQLDGRHSLCARRAAELARARGIAVLAEAEVRKGSGRAFDLLMEGRASLLRLADYVVMSEEYPTRNGLPMEQGIKIVLIEEAPLAKYAVVTLGSEGCLAVCRDGWRTIRVPAISLSEHEVIDTTGAGDAFQAGLVYSIVRGYPLEEGLRLACWMGAQNCKACGARGALPREDALLEACGPPPAKKAKI